MSDRERLVCVRVFNLTVRAVVAGVAVFSAPWFLFMAVVPLIGSVELERDPNRLLHLVTFLKAKHIVQSLEKYKADCGAYPPPSVGLDALVHDPGVRGWKGPYMDRAALDGRHRPYRYSLSPAGPEVVSYGADGKPGGSFFDSDISSRDPERVMPESPRERGARYEFLAIRIGSWLALPGCIFALWWAFRQPRAKPA